MFSRRNIRKIPHKGEHHTIFTPYKNDSAAEIIASMQVHLCKLKSDIEDMQKSLVMLAQSSMVDSNE